MAERKQYLSRYRAEAHNNLQDYSLSRCKTILIGSLEEFENGFGFLWGHGKPFSSLNDEEKELRELWKEVRLEILGKGEFRMNQLRQRFSMYEIKNKTTQVFRLPQDEGKHGTS